jgi:predicted small metal-binding protein
MAEERKERLELDCRETGTDCDFVAQGQTVEEILACCAEHAETTHGMISFPPDLWVRMRSRVRTVKA